MANNPLGRVWQYKNPNNASIRVSIPDGTFQGGFVVDGAFSGFSLHENKSGGVVEGTIVGSVGDCCETTQFDDTKTYTDGAKLYWNSTTGKFTNDSTSAIEVGQMDGAFAGGAKCIRFFKTRD